MPHSTRILVCRTCPRYAPSSAATKGEGLRLAAAVKAVLAEAGLSADFPVRIVSCLAGCMNPCNAALDGPDSYRLRFSALGTADAVSLLAAARIYRQDPGDGNLSLEQLPEPLRGRLTARSPDRIGD